MVGLGDLDGLLQPKRFDDSMILSAFECLKATKRSFDVFIAQVYSTTVL